jgi:hypothetical protein
MDKKITRRAVLGVAVAALAAGPFVIREWHRRRRITLPPDSFLAGLRTRFESNLSFPRKFDITFDDGSQSPMSGTPNGNEYRKALDRFYSLPKDVQNTIMETQRRYWENFAQIDELEFECTNFE